LDRINRIDRISKAEDNTPLESVMGLTTQHEGLTRQIIGCAYKVYNTMGFGFLESVYEKCMAIELAKLGLRAKVQAPISVLYEGQVVGEFFADLWVEDAVIVELKSVRAIATVHETQLVNYLKATHTDVGLVINFGEGKVEVKRKVRELPPAAPPNDDF
jgi:GxxExxY protein